jgi:hypothetical protein
VWCGGLGLRRTGHNSWWILCYCGTAVLLLIISAVVVAFVSNTNSW